jgi:3-isopropylmalate/(R)-2-methylmalate dehydratase small subunit
LKLVLSNDFQGIKRMAKLEGKVWRFGDNIDTDLIIAARYLNTSDPYKLAEHVMEDASPEFAKSVKNGDIIVAGSNFGSGSSREHAPIALKYAGVSAVVASSFARIFYRNSFNMGLPIFEIDSVNEIEEGSNLSIDMDNGEIVNLTTGKSYKFKPIPEFMQELVNAGGLINYAKEKLAKEEV